MKPIRLVMQAFGSYGTRSEIDFTRPNQNLFLITGDTGAGKTTIFDAIVFALYGEASSGENRKDGAELQSQYAKNDAEPFVELVFSEEENGEARQYRVQRTPRHIRPKKRGEGNIDIKETVSLFLPDGREYAAGQKETDQRLEEIVGLSKDQFMQVAMIAQGEFMELLRADSNRKKEIFRKLFGTEKFQNIVAELAKRCEDKAGEMAEIRTACGAETAHLVIPEDVPGAEELKELKDRILRAKEWNAADMECLMAELPRLCGELEKRQQETEHAAKDASAQRDRCRDQLQKAELLSESYRQQETALLALSEWEGQKEELRKKELLMRRIRTAGDLQEIFRRRTEAKERFDRVRKQKKDWEAELPERIRQEQELEEKRLAAVEAQKTTLEEKSRASERVDKARSLFRELEEEKTKIRDGEQKSQEAKRALEQAEKIRETYEEQEKNWREQEQQLSDTGIRRGRWEQKREKAAQIQENLETVRNLEQEEAAQQKELEALQKDYAALRETCVKKKEAYAQMQLSFLDAQAGFLARTLKKGQPCPVCGSTEHPSPCPLPHEKGKTVTKEELDEESAELARLEEELSTKAGAAGIAGKLAEEKRRQKEERWKDVALQMTQSKMDQSVLTATELSGRKERQGGQDRCVTPNAQGISGLREGTRVFSQEEAGRLLQNWNRQLSEEGKELNQREQRLAELQKNLAAVPQRRQELQQTVEQAQALLSRVNQELAAAVAAGKKLEDQKSFATREEAEQFLSEIVGKAEKADELLRTAERKAKESGNRREQLSALLLRAEKELPQLQKDREAADREYEGTLKRSGLSEAEWQETASRHPKEEAEKLQEELTQAEREKARAEGTLEAARKAIGDQKKPDLELLKNQCSGAEEVLLAATKRAEACREAFRTDERTWRALAPRMEERMEKGQEYTKLRGMYDRLAGKVSGSRMDLETFVQRCYLQRILWSANLRFSEMSAGQYELRMVEENQAGAGKNRGLDLMVYSAVTGREREVRTLSGGESFMAALSLALGMADQIQENSSAIHLDMMFIDEGFGSLDDHARQEAVHVLQRMAGGAKLIGIISHVTELKQEIEDQLIVTKDENGSRTRWQIS